MALRTTSHVIGDVGHLTMRMMFAQAGYATGDVSPDYGEDFVVFCDDGGIIEPFKIYVQAKTTNSKKPRWSMRIPSLTVRNWVLSNDLTVVMRLSLRDRKVKFAIPEEDISYWSLVQKAGDAVNIICDRTFLSNTAERLAWKARIRHYDRICRINDINEFEDNRWKDIPEYRLFVAEMLSRMGILSTDSGEVCDEFFGMHFPMTALIMCGQEKKDTEHARYGACAQLVLNRVYELSGGEGMRPAFLDKCASLLYDFVRARVNKDLDVASRGR